MVQFGGSEDGEHEPGRLERAIRHSFGLKPADVARVGVTAMTLKYISWGVIVVGVGYFRPVTKFVQSQLAPRARRQWVDFAKSNPNAKVWATRAAHAQGGARNVAVSARRSARLMAQWARARSEAGMARARESTTILKRTVKFWDKWMTKYVDLVGDWQLLKFGATVARVEPKQLAGGIAEGLIFYKMTLPIHFPMCIWLAVQWHRRQEAEAEGSERIRRVP